MTTVVVYSLSTGEAEEVILAGDALEAFEASRAALARHLPDLTMRQFRLGLLGAGLLDEVEAAIDGLSEPERSAARIEFEYASSVSRTSAWVATLAGPLNLTDEQINNLWRSAGAL